MVCTASGVSDTSETRAKEAPPAPMLSASTLNTAAPPPDAHRDVHEGKEPCDSELRASRQEAARHVTAFSSAASARSQPPCASSSAPFLPLPLGAADTAPSLNSSSTAIEMLDASVQVDVLEEEEGDTVHGATGAACGASGRDTNASLPPRGIEEITKQTPDPLEDSDSSAQGTASAASSTTVALPAASHDIDAESAARATSRVFGSISTMSGAAGVDVSVIGVVLWGHDTCWRRMPCFDSLLHRPRRARLCRYLLCLLGGERNL